MTELSTSISVTETTEERGGQTRELCHIPKNFEEAKRAQQGKAYLAACGTKKHKPLRPHDVCGFYFDCQACAVCEDLIEQLGIGEWRQEDD